MTAEKKTIAASRKAKPIRKTFHYKDSAGEKVYTLKLEFNASTGRYDSKCYVGVGRFGTPKKRLLYNLAEIAQAYDDTIFICKNENSADVMGKLGYVATACMGGELGWKTEYKYAKPLEDHDIVVMPSTDDKADRWLQAILRDLRGNVTSIRIIHPPQEIIDALPDQDGLDIADIYDEFGEEGAIEWVDKAVADAEVMIRGYERGNTKTPKEAYEQYKKELADGSFDVIDLSMWLPTMKVTARKGDSVVLLAGTGVGKSRSLMSLMEKCNKTTYLGFDLELADTVTGERWCAYWNGVSVDEVRTAAAMGHPFDMPEIPHITMCNRGAIDADFIKEEVKAYEAMNDHLGVIAIDYIGLMQARSGIGAVEKLSSIAEDTKGMANTLGKVVIMTSQRSRPADKEEGMYQCPSLYDNKGSSAIENSAQIVIGLWMKKPEGDGVQRLGARLLKWSHGVKERIPDVDLIAKDLRIEEE